jgi:hypothetical protein
MSNQDRDQFWQESNQYFLFASTPNFANGKTVLRKLSDPSSFIIVPLLILHYSVFKGLTQSAGGRT